MYRIPHLDNLTNPRIEEWSPEGKALCYIINKPIETGGFEDFAVAADKTVKHHGEMRVLVYYRNYQGYEAEAAKMDMAASATYGPVLSKLAMVNAPERVMFNIKLRSSTNPYNCETRFFAESDLQDAIIWVNN